jgi:signal transduction histidine kinase
MIDSTFKKANILIVDDQQANIDILEGLLEIQGYENIKSTTDPRQVIDLYKIFEPDLVLLDLMMPYLSGFEVMNLLKETIPQHSFLPIIVLTADVTPESKQKALAGGAIDFITKPFDLVEVGLRIGNLLFASHLQQQLMNQNVILDEKVKARTIELEKKNQELLIAKDKAEASDRLKTAFINNISHEIRTPLNGILGFGQILAEFELSAEEKSEYLERLNFSSNRLINTVTNFIDISMLNSGTLDLNLKEFEVRPVVDQVLESFKKQCHNKEIELIAHLPTTESYPSIVSDKDLVSRCLFHLVDNAVKFTPDGHISVSTEVKNQHFYFKVADTGIGVLDEYKNQIFKSFMQENSALTRGYEGSGLGLSIVKGFVDLLGGLIGLDSEKEKGSVFYFSVPVAEQAQLPGEDELTITQQKPGGVYTILVAEDDEFNFFYINFILKLPSIKVIHALNGLQAVEYCKNLPEIDLVLMDLKMPEMDGFEATEIIKSMRNTLPVIAVTAFAGAEDKKHAFSAGCDEFITKPVKKELLMKTMAKFGVIV